MMSRTQRDFGWPRVVPILERATLPPITTGPRVFCPKPDPKDLCKQDDYQDYDTRLDSCNPAKFDQRYDDEDEVLMSRKKFMLLNEAITCEPIATIANQKMKSTFQVGFGHKKSKYKDIKDKLQVPRDEASVRRCHAYRSFHDPFPFKKFNDQHPLIG